MPMSERCGLPRLLENVAGYASRLRLGPIVLDAARRARPSRTHRVAVMARHQMAPVWLDGCWTVQHRFSLGEQLVKLAQSRELP